MKNAYRTKCTLPPTIPPPSPHHDFVCLVKCFPKLYDMTGSAKNHGGDRFQGKDLDAGQGLPHRDWAGILATQTFLNSNLVTPENFIQYCPSV